MAETRNLTILLTDIKGFTDKTSRQSRADMMSMLDTHNHVVLPVLQSKGGRLIKTIGDAFLMVYDSPTDAVLAGVAVQDALREHNKDKPADNRIEVRVAINSGEVTLADNDVFGEPVNITARIEGIADAGEVFFTEAVYLAMNKNEVPSSEVGLLQLKGIPEKIRVYKVRKELPVEGMPESKAPKKMWDRLKQTVAAPAGTQAARGPFAPIPKRTAALFVDLLVVGTVSTMFRHDLPTHEGFLIFWGIYNWILVRKLGGATFGKRILRIKVASQDGAALDKKQALWRSAFSLVSLSALGLGYAWALFDKERRTWHDLVANTIVLDA